MYKRALVVITVVILLGAAWARAQESDTATPVTRIQNATISGPSTEVLSAVCPPPSPETGYLPDTCPSGTGHCSCITMMTPDVIKVNGSLAGSGIAVVNFTVDSGSSVVTSSVSGSTCEPAYGEADLTTMVGTGKNKTQQTESINLLAAICDSKNAKSPETLNGGWGIAASPAPSPNGALGWGTFSGTETATKMTLKLNGSVTR
jgi:hypothetical protein